MLINDIELSSALDAVLGTVFTGIVFCDFFGLLFLALYFFLLVPGYVTSRAITLWVDNQGHYAISLYAVNGKKSVLEESYLAPGCHRISLGEQCLALGVYIVTISFNSFTVSTMLLVK